VTIAVSLAIVGIARYVRRGNEGGTRTVATLALVIVALVATSRSTQAMWLRMTSEGQGTWYRAAVAAPASLALKAGEASMVPVRVTNLGRLTWDSTAEQPFFLSYHWLKADGSRVVSFEGARTPFPAPVVGGGSVAVNATVWTPSQSGEYRLQWDVVQEHRLWFNTEPDAPAPSVTNALVSGMNGVASESAPSTRSLQTSPLPKRTVRPGRLTLWRTAVRMFAAHPVFGVGPDNFRLQYGEVAGLSDADPRTHSNSMYVEMFVGGGIVGGAAFLWLMWTAAGLSVDAVRRSANVTGLGVAAAVAAVLIHGFVDSFFSFTPAYIVIAFTLGLAVVTHADCI